MKGEFDVAHPEGKLTIKLPNTLTTQTPLRVKGKGFKRSGFGDFYLKIDLSIDRTQLNNN
jgi:DnaJ-class molecular chaperone